MKITAAIKSDLITYDYVRVRIGSQDNYSPRLYSKLYVVLTFRKLIEGHDPFTLLNRKSNLDIVGESKQPHKTTGVTGYSNINLRELPDEITEAITKEKAILKLRGIT